MADDIELYPPVSRGRSRNARANDLEGQYVDTAEVARHFDISEEVGTLGM